MNHNTMQTETKEIKIAEDEVRGWDEVYKPDSDPKLWNDIRAQEKFKAWTLKYGIEPGYDAIGNHVRGMDYKGNKSLDGPTWEPGWDPQHPDYIGYVLGKEEMERQSGHKWPGPDAKHTRLSGECKNFEECTPADRLVPIGNKYSDANRSTNYSRSLEPKYAAIILKRQDEKLLAAIAAGKVDGF
jgi:hypothetical protein